jgi:hypothetical protein
MRHAVFVIALVCAGAAAAQPVPSLAVSGSVSHPGPVALAGLKQVAVSASFHTRHGQEAHTWRGPLLLDVIGAARLVDAPGKKTHMQHVILARGSDGYAAAIAIGELEAGGEGKQVIVALTEDGKPVPAPRLIVPGDASFARGVHDLTGLDVR